MVAPDRLHAFALAAFVLIVIPGPSVLFVISRGVALGRRAALATVMGNTTGVIVQVAAVAAGVGAILQRSVLLFSVLKFCGAVYLVYLGVRMWRERKALSGLLDVAVIPRSARRIYLDGLMVGVTNPKAAVFFAAVLPQFADPARGGVPLQIMVLGLVFAAIAIVSDSAWGLAAGTLRAWLHRSPQRLEQLGGAGGLAVVGLGIQLAFSQRKQ